MNKTTRRFKNKIFDLCMGRIHNRRVFKIPIGNITEKEVMEKMRELMKSYNEEIEFPKDYVIKCNNIDHSRDIWYPNNSIGL